ncbi:MAG: lipopolysaccharide kinase InaA family protein [bacterium]
MKEGGYKEFRRNGWEGLLAPEHEKDLVKLFSADKFPSAGFEGLVEEFHSNVGRTFRVYLCRESASPDFYAKSFEVEGILQVLKSVFVLSAAARSWKAARVLSESGIAVPRPVAFAERKKLGRRAESVIISEAVAGSEGMNLQNYFIKHFDQKPLSRERLREKRLILQKLAELYSLAHSQDTIYLPDFHPHNMLWQKRGEGDYSLYLVDFDEVNFRVRKNDRLKNLASLCRNADKIVKKMDHNVITTGDRLRFLRHYLEDLGEKEGTADLEELWKKVLDNLYLR